MEASREPRAIRVSLLQTSTINFERTETVLRNTHLNRTLDLAARMRAVIHV